MTVAAWGLVCRLRNQSQSCSTSRVARRAREPLPRKNGYRAVHRPRRLRCSASGPSTFSIEEGYLPEDVELLQQIGQAGYVTVTEYATVSMDGVKKDVLKREEPSVVNLFAARVSATRDRNLVGKESLVLVKEFTPQARYLGEKEVTAYHRLLALPETEGGQESGAQPQGQREDSEQPVSGVNEWFANMAKKTVAGSPPTSTTTTISPEKKKSVISELQRRSRTAYGFFEPDSRPLKSDPPVSPCAGYLLAEGEDEYPSDQDGGVNLDDGATANSLWIIFRVGNDGGITWELPMALDAAMQAWDPAPSRLRIAAEEAKSEEEKKKERFQKFLGRVLEGPGPRAQLEARETYARTLCTRAVEALEFCHSRGVAHGALAANCLCISTVDWWDYRRLSVKLDNFAFCQVLSESPSEEEQGMFREACRNDLNTLGLILLEFVLGAFSPEGKAPDANQASLMAVLKVAGEADSSRLRDWCERPSPLNPERRRFEDALLFLEQEHEEGWKFLEYLLSNREDASASDAYKLAFLQR